MSNSNKSNSKYNRLLLAAGGSLIFFAFAFTGGSDTPVKNKKYHPVIYDTIPSKDKIELRRDSEIDFEHKLDLERVKEKMHDLEYNMKRIQDDIRKKDWSEIERAYRKTINDIDWKKMKEDAMLANDRYAAIARKVQLENTLRLAEVQQYIAKAGEEINNQKLQSLLQHNIQRRMQDVQKELEIASKQLQRLNTFKDELEADGLIKKGEKYTIEIKKGDLYINDKKQPSRISRKYRDKYKEYFDDENNFRLQSGNKEQAPAEDELI